VFKKKFALFRLISRLKRKIGPISFRAEDGEVAPVAGICKWHAVLQTRAASEGSAVCLLSKVQINLHSKTTRPTRKAFDQFFIRHDKYLRCDFKTGGKKTGTLNRIEHDVIS
jgi:hypothetical protein